MLAAFVRFVSSAVKQGVECAVKVSVAPSASEGDLQHDDDDDVANTTAASALDAVLCSSSLSVLSLFFSRQFTFSLGLVVR